MNSCTINGLKQRNNLIAGKPLNEGISMSYHGNIPPHLQNETKQKLPRDRFWLKLMATVISQIIVGTLFAFYLTRLQ